MNRCCVKKIQCKHATNYGVCKLSSAYDCKPAVEEHLEDYDEQVLEDEISDIDFFIKEAIK